MKTKGEVREVHFKGIPALAVAQSRSAKKRFWMATYTMPHDNTLKALDAAHRRGVNVRLVVSAVTVEALPKGHPFKMKRVAVSGSGTMHSKFIVIDDQVLTGSSNFNDPRSRNVAVLLRGTVVRHFAAEFNKLWKLKAGPKLLRGDKAAALVEKVAAKRGWSAFLTTVSNRSLARGYLTPKERAALEKTLK